MAESRTSAHDCAICKNNLRASANPKLLMCYHSFCLGCIEKLAERIPRGSMLKCPICRTHTSLPVGGVKNLQTNFYIIDKPDDNDRFCCDSCGRNIRLSRRCVDCQQNFCDMCASCHANMTSSKEHKLTDISGMTELDDTVKLKTRSTCPLHGNNEIEMFCTECDKVICVVCKLTVHFSHSCTDISTEASKRRQAIKASVKESKTRTESTKVKAANSKEHIQTVCQKLTESIDELESKKNDLVCYMNREFDTRKRAIVSKINQFREANSNTVTSCQKASKSFELKIASSLKAVTDADDLEIITAFGKISEELRGVQDKECPITSDDEIENALLDCGIWLESFNGQRQMSELRWEVETLGKKSAFIDQRRQRGGARLTLPDRRMTKTSTKDPTQCFSKSTTFRQRISFSDSDD